MPKNRRRCKSRCYVLLLLFLLLLGTGLFLRQLPLFGADTYTVAAANTVRDIRKVQGLFLYNETVVSAPVAGTWCSGCTAGDSLAAGEPVGELKKLNDINTDPVVMIFSPISGIYTDALDGWETLFQNGLPDSLDLAKVFLQSRETATAKVNDFVQQGEACFKVISVKGTVELLLDLGELKLNQDTVSLSLYGKTYDAAVKKQTVQRDHTYLLVTLPNETAFLQSRFVEPNLILGTKEGVVVSNSAVFSRFGKTGVYCNQEGKLHYREIGVLAQDEENTMVSGLEAGACVLCRRE